MGVESEAGSTAKPITLRLYVVRGVEVIFDRDLAAFYGIPTKRLNLYVKRHAERFPPDFAFELTRDEWRSILEIEPKRIGRGGLGHCPHAFTEQGVMSVAGIMRGRRAALISIELLRAFVRSREDETEGLLSWGKDLLSNREQIDLLAKELFGDEPGTVTDFIQAGPGGPIKIGISTNFESRFRSLEMSSPVPLRILGVIPGDIESECHVLLARWRMHGEWFEPSREVKAFIRERLPRTPRVN